MSAIGESAIGEAGIGDASGLAISEPAPPAIISTTIQPITVLVVEIDAEKPT